VHPGGRGEVPLQSAVLGGIYSSWGGLPGETVAIGACIKEREVRDGFLTQQGLPERRGFDLEHPPVYMVDISELLPRSPPGPPRMTLGTPSHYGQLLRPPAASHHLECIFPGYAGRANSSTPSTGTATSERWVIGDGELLSRLTPSSYNPRTTWAARAPPRLPELR
jgi:hypothetical protein